MPVDGQLVPLWKSLKYLPGAVTGEERTGSKAHGRQHPPTHTHTEAWHMISKNLAGSKPCRVTVASRGRS